MRGPRVTSRWLPYWFMWASGDSGMVSGKGAVSRTWSPILARFDVVFRIFDVLSVFGVKRLWALPLGAPGVGSKYFLSVIREWPKFF
jgi:hypothetical protein